MRATRWLPSILAVGLGAMACSSSNSGGGDGGSSSADASKDGSRSCGDIAACYDVTVTVDSSSPASCGTGAMVLSDYTSVTGDGPITTPKCQGQLSNCVMTLTCNDGSSWNYTFTSKGFSATITQSPCTATAVGTRLSACPVTVSSGDDGGMGDATVDGGASDATIDGIADAGRGPDAASDGGGDALAPTDSSASEGGRDASADVGVGDSGVVEGGGADAGAPDGAMDEGGDGEAGAPDGGGDDGGDAEAGSPDGSDDSLADGGADADDGSDSG